MSTDENIGGMEEQRALVAEYALGLLAADEHTAVARRIAAEPALRRELGVWRRRLASLDGEFAEQPAPAAMLSRVERRLFGGAAKGGWWNSLAVWRSLAGAAAAVAVVAVGFNLIEPRQLTPQEFGQQLVAAIEAQEGSGVSFVALYDPESGHVRLTSLSGNAMPNNDYELWAIQGDAAPVSLGVINVAEKEIMPMPEDMPEFGAGTVLAVSIEPKGGSPTGAPTGKVVAAGAAMAI